MGLLSFPRQQETPRGVSATMRQGGGPQRAVHFPELARLARRQWSELRQGAFLLRVVAHRHPLGSLERGLYLRLAAGQREKSREAQAPLEAAGL